MRAKLRGAGSYAAAAAVQNRRADVALYIRHGGSVKRDPPYTVLAAAARAVSRLGVPARSHKKRAGMLSFVNFRSNKPCYDLGIVLALSRARSSQAISSATVCYTAASEIAAFSRLETFRLAVRRDRKDHPSRMARRLPLRHSRSAARPLPLRCRANKPSRPLPTRKVDHHCAGACVPGSLPTSSACYPRSAAWLPTQSPAPAVDYPDRTRSHRYQSAGAMGRGHAGDPKRHIG